MRKNLRSASIWVSLLLVGLLSIVRACWPTVPEETKPAAKPFEGQALVTQSPSATQLPAQFLSSTPTLTPTPTSTPEPTNTPKLTSTPEPTSTPKPTRERPKLTATPMLYPAPVLLGHELRKSHLVLRWTWGGQLKPNEYFDVRVWKDGEPHKGIAWERASEHHIDLSSWP